MEAPGGLGARTYPGLPAAALQHPSDRAAVEALLRLPLAPIALERLQEAGYEQALLVATARQSVRLGPEQLPEVYGLLVRAAKALDVRPLPELYLDASREPWARGFGLQKYIIVLSAGLLDMLDDDELLVVLSQELGHIKCEHQPLKTLATLACRLGAQLAPILGVGEGAAGELQGLLFDWARKSKLSCDRAALLVVQAPQPVTQALARLSGGRGERRSLQLNPDALHQQAAEGEYLEDSRLHRAFSLFPHWDAATTDAILRTRLLLEWAGSPAFAQLQAGQYARAAPRAAPPLSSPPPRERASTIHSTIHEDFRHAAPPPPPQRPKRPAAYCRRCNAGIEEGQARCGRCGSPAPSYKP